MAAETSADAKVPVALALAKLGVIFAVKNWESMASFTISPEWKTRIELYWDLYLLTMLVGVLGILLFIRRPRLRQTPPTAAPPPPAARAEPRAEAAQWIRHTNLVIEELLYRPKDEKIRLLSVKWKEKLRSVSFGSKLCFFVSFVITPCWVFFDRNFLMPTSDALEDRNSERRYFTLFWVVFGKTKNTERLWC